jgi:tetratricopeptide (TPR) repeat protein
MSLLHGVIRLARHTRTLAGAAAALLAIAAMICCDAAADAPPESLAAPANPPSRADAYTDFRRLFDAGNYAAAAPQAQRVAELTEKELGPASDELQVALMNLATTQYLSGDYVGAESSYLRVIELTERSGKPRLERLARANAGLAATYHQGQRHDLAVQRFEKAVALNRRAEGLLNERQLPLLDKYTDSLTELGRFEEALQVQRYAMRIAERKYGESDPRLAPALEKLGRWYARVGAYEPSRATLKRAIRLVEDAQGLQSPNLVGPLTALAECNRLQLLDPAQSRMTAPDMDRASLFRDAPEPLPFPSPTTAAEGQQALERAAAIVTAHADSPPLQVADVYTQLGDWFEARSQPERALPHYQQAWQAAGKATFQGKPLVDLLFGKPVLLNYVRPSSWNRYGSRPREEIELKTVVLDITVTAQGKVRDPRVVDDSGDERRAEQTVQAAATALYRPRFENGRPAETPNLSFTQAWVVLLPKPPAAASAPDPAPTPDKDPKQR